jgi:Amidase
MGNMDTDLSYSDATKLAELIRNREVTSVEVVRAHLDRIDAINPKINAIVTRAAGALDAAVAADEALAAGAAVGSRHGVPFTVKDSIRNAGGILIAKTNLPEPRPKGLRPAAMAADSPGVAAGVVSSVRDLHPDI